VKPIHYQLPLKLRGYGHAEPERSVTNIELLARTPQFKGRPDSFLEKVEERMVQGFGFKKRRMLALPGDDISSIKESSETLGVESGRKALLNLTERPEILIHGTTTTSRYTGSQATAIAGKLGLTIPAYETKAGCSTGLAGLHMAYSFLSSGYESALCVFSETLSKVIDLPNQEAWFGLADGAASLFISKTATGESDFTVLKSLFFTDGEHIDLYSTQGMLPPTAPTLAAGGYVLRGDPEKLRQQALRRYQDLISTLLTDEERRSIRHIMCHQVNRQLVTDVIELTGISGEPFWINHEYGNIGGTTIPFSICLAMEQKKFESGDLILLMSVGGGVSAAAQLWRWT
jgi:3-oxoacyl-[acyl-carrier-protein] synthase III